MTESYNNLIETIKKYNPVFNEELVKKAFDMAVSSHDGQMRKSGEPFVMHPLAVATILAEMELDVPSIVAGLLHDTIEDTDVSHEDIKSIFGEEIVTLVEGVTKLGKIPYSTMEEQQVENLRKMFLAMAKDIRVILIKLADRLHNLRTLGSLPEAKRRHKAWETLEVYAPLANRLGIFKIKTEMEDLSLLHLDPVGYGEIVNHIEKLKSQRKEYISEILETVKTRISEISIKAYITGRTKNIYSTYKKMYAQNKSIDEIYDLYAIRIIVDSVSDCYAVLGMVHDLYKPIPGRFKDYIAMPKPNMYQSLHTTMLGSLGIPFEIQIRTWDMHQTAEFGIAAHWKYKEGKSGVTDLDSKLSWLRQLLEIQKDTTDADEFMKNIKIDLFNDEVFVFSPKGDVINLPAGSNLIDFAFAIHSEVGNHMLGAKVNGKIVPIEYCLKNGDIAEIITSSSVYGPSFDWLKLAKTSQARNKINQWFKKENRADNIARGKELIEYELKKLNSTYSAIMKPDFINSLLKRFSLKNFDDLLSGIGYGGIPLSKILPRLKEEIKLSEKAEENDVSGVIISPAKKHEGSGVVVEGIDNCLVRLSHCCNPVPGDRIIGYITRGRGVSVHRADCKNMDFVLSSPEEKERLIPVSWKAGGFETYFADILVTTRNRDGILGDIVGVYSELKISIREMNAKITKNGNSSIYISMAIHSVAQIDNVIGRLQKIKDVFDVVRYHK